ncbi:MAG: AMP-binding protein [Sheuella sp.]|nr:AMP-binding protein [Sheuella sp.]
MYPIDFFYRASKLYPERCALQSSQVSITYRELATQVASFAAALQAIDPTPQSRVGICAANSTDHAMAILAVMAAGKVWVPLNARSTRPEITRILAATEPSIVITDETGELLVGDITSTKLQLGGADPLTGVHQLIAQHQTKSPKPISAGEDAIQAIKFTGGTTGAPKGVMQPYRAWTAGIINQVSGWQITADDCYVVTAPLTHGTSTYLMPLLAQGGRLLFLDKTDPGSIIAAFRDQGGTMSFMPPTLIYMVMAYPGVTRADFPALRNLIYGGAPMPADKVEQVGAFFGPVIGTTYGQTEAPQIVTMLRPGELGDPLNKGSVGRCTWLTDLGIMAPDGALLLSNEIGEVVVRGDLMMKGYWRLPEKTAETIIDGWLHTGDVGLVDERGYLFLKDRIRDVIITGGFNVYPTDVENALSQHPSVYECSVFGMPDDKWGEAVQAAIHLRPGFAQDPEGLMAHVKKALGSVQTPKQIYFFEQLPKSSVGKVLKTAIKEQIQKH